MTAAAVQTFIYIIVDGVNLLVFGLLYSYSTLCYYMYSITWTWSSVSKSKSVFLYSTLPEYVVSLGPNYRIIYLLTQQNADIK